MLEIICSEHIPGLGPNSEVTVEVEVNREALR